MVHAKFACNRYTDWCRIRSISCYLQQRKILDSIAERYDNIFMYYAIGSWLIIHFFSGLRGDTESIRQHAIESDTFFPYLHDVSKRAPWILDNTNQDYLDAVINNILIPTGYKSAFDVKHVFQRTGNLRYLTKLEFSLTN